MTYSGKVNSNQAVENWVKATQTGETAAFEALYNYYIDSIYRFCFWQTGENQAAEDLTAETFRVALTQIKTYQAKGSFTNWLYTIAKRQVFSWLRDKYRYLPIEQIHESIPDQPVLIEPDGDAYKRKLIAQLLKRLSERDRQVVVLRYLKNYSIKETASAMNLNPSQVTTITNRAKKTLQSYYEEYYAQLK